MLGLVVVGIWSALARVCFPSLGVDQRKGRFWRSETREIKAARLEVNRCSQAAPRRNPAPYLQGAIAGTRGRPVGCGEDG